MTGTRGGTTETKRGADLAHVRLLKALAHPRRLEILGILSHQDVLSPAEFARRVCEPVSNVSYHFRLLKKLGCIEVVDTRPARGSYEHLYKRLKYVVFDDDSWLRMPDEARQIVAGTILRDLVARMTQALQAGTFTARDDVHITWKPVKLDEEGWREVMEILGAAYKAIDEVEIRAAERMAISKEESLTATVALAGFESPKGQSVGQNSCGN